MRSVDHRFHVNLARVLRDWLSMDACQCEVTTIVSSDVGGFVFQSASTGEVKGDLLAELNHCETFASPGCTSRGVQECLDAPHQSLFRKFRNSINHCIFRHATAGAARRTQGPLMSSDSRAFPADAVTAARCRPASAALTKLEFVFGHLREDIRHTSNHLSPVWGLYAMKPERVARAILVSVQGVQGHTPLRRRSRNS